MYVHITLFLTYNCNFKCKHCAFFCGPNRKNTDMKKWQIDYICEFIKRLKKIGHTTDHIRISGGEASLHKDFHNIINKLHKLDYNLTIVTNGTREIPVKNFERIDISRDIYHDEFENILPHYYNTDNITIHHNELDILKIGRGKKLFSNYSKDLYEESSYCSNFNITFPMISFDYKQIRFCENNAFNRKNVHNFVNYNNIYLRHPDILLRKSENYIKYHSGKNCPLHCKIIRNK